MDDDAGLEMLRLQELHLIKTFLRIADASKRRRILDLAEQLAEEAGLGAAEPGPATASTVEDYKGSPGRIE